MGGLDEEPHETAGAEVSPSLADPALLLKAGATQSLVLALVDEAIAAWRASLDPRRTGRPSRWIWEDHREWLCYVANRLARTNAADYELSMTEAVWSSADHPLTPLGFKGSLQQQKTRFSYSTSLRAILRYIGARIVTVRGRDRDQLDRGLTGRGFLRRHWAEHRRLWGGEQISFDDGSINLVLWVDWPFGGAGKVSERWGCIVGRFQLLLCEDAGTGFLPGYSFVARPLGAYRAEDALGTIARMSRYQVQADRHILEKATWASHAIKDFYAATGIECINTYSPKHKLVETAFNRLWGRMAPDERLSLGRFRGDDEAGNALWTKLRAGTVDPRLHCQSLAEVVAMLDRVIGRANTEPLTSKTYGSWVPAERWAQDLRDHPRERLADDLWWAWAPVRRDPRRHPHAPRHALRHHRRGRRDCRRPHYRRSDPHQSHAARLRSRCHPIGSGDRQRRRSRRCPRQCCRCAHAAARPPHARPLGVPRRRPGRGGRARSGRGLDRGGVAMKHFPATHAPARLAGLAGQLTQSDEPRPSIVRSRAAWFALGFFAAATVAGLIAGGLFS